MIEENILLELLNNDETLINYHKLNYLLKKNRNILKSRYIKIISYGKNILDILKKEGVNFIVLKGLFFANELYKNIGEREFGDIDILVNADQLDLVSKVLSNEKFIQGSYSDIKNDIVPMTKKEMIAFRIYSHQIGSFLKIQDELLIDIDVNFKMMWIGIDKNEIPNSIAFENSCPFCIGNSIFNTLNYELHLIHACCHIYSEAVYFFSNPNFNISVDSKELKLFRLLDILHLLEKSLNWDYIFKLCHEYQVICAVKYVFKILDELFPFYISDNLKAKLEFNDNDANYFFDKNGKKIYWTISLKDRLFNINLKIDTLKKIFNRAYIV